MRQSKATWTSQMRRRAPVMGKLRIDSTVCREFWILKLNKNYILYLAVWNFYVNFHCKGTYSSSVRWREHQEENVFS